MIKSPKSAASNDDLAAHEVLEFHFDLRRLEADHFRALPAADAWPACRLCGPAVAVVLWRQSLREHRLALRFDVFLAAIAIIRVAASISCFRYFLYISVRSLWRYGPYSPCLAVERQAGRRRPRDAGLRPSPTRATKVPARSSASYFFSERSLSVSSMRSTNVPPYLRAKSQLNSAVRAPPTWSGPVGLGAKRTRIGLDSSACIALARGAKFGADASMSPILP